MKRGIFVIFKNLFLNIKKQSLCRFLKLDYITRLDSQSSSIDERIFKFTLILALFNNDSFNIFPSLD